MVFCPECKNLFSSVDVLKVHLRNSHNDNLFCKYKCKETGCSRYFDTWRAYRKHLVDFHKCPVSDIIIKPVEHVPLVCNETYDNLVDADPLDKGVVVDTFDDLSDVSFDLFKSMIQKSGDILLSKMYQKAIIPRNFVQTVLDDFSNFFCGEFLVILEKKVMCVLSESESPNVQVIRNMFSCLKDPFAHLSSDFKRMKYFEKTSCYIKPEPYTICESRDKLFKTKKGGVTKRIKTTGQFVSLRAVLKKLFELPGALKKTLEYKQEVSDSEFCTNLIQCELWKKKTAHFKESDIVLPLNFYFDDVEPNNALGPHSESLGAGYTILPLLPPACQSKLENILLTCLIDADDRKSDDNFKTSYNKEVFAPVIKEFNFLQSEGILCQTEIGEKRIHFVLNSISGDNLGIHGITGFAESFTCNYPCTVCRASKELTRTMTVEDPNLFRNRVNYSEDVKTNNVTLTGIKEQCVFNSINSFHVTENRAQDVMHDLAEGVSHYVLIPILKHCLDCKYFDLDKLNARMSMLDFGPLDWSKPSIIQDDFHSKTKLKFTASETYTFIRLLGVLVGDLVPEEDEYWKLYKLHKEICDIFLAHKMPFDFKDELQVLVKEHHELYMRLTGNHLPPKFHYLLHSATMLLSSGPFPQFSSMRGEAKHRFLTSYARAITCRRNLPKSIAIKHQLSQCYRFISESPLVSPIVEGPQTLVDLEFHENYLAFQHSLPEVLRNKSEVSTASWVDYWGTHYEPSMVLIHSVDSHGAYLFVKIDMIVVIDDHPLFICNVLSNIGLSAHVGGFEVYPSKKYKCVFHRDLHDPFPLFDFCMNNGERIVVLKHYVC